MSQIESPRFLEAPESIWVKCEKVTELSEMEAACLILDARGEHRLIVVEPLFCNLEEKLVQASKVATSERDESNWLVDFASGQRLLVSEGQVIHGHLV